MKVRAFDFGQAMKMDPLELLRLCGGYYETPRGADGKRTGPLVGYTARYADTATGEQKQWVGDIYANWAMAEANSTALGALSRRMSRLIIEHCDRIGVDPRSISVCGIPEGGRSFAAVVAGYLPGSSHMYPEKVVVAPATATEREKTELRFKRHEPQKGVPVFLVEDVSNNFSSTGQIIAEVEKHGATVAGIVTNLNRSPTVGERFDYRGTPIPVLALVHKPMFEYHQNDPEVSADIAAGNISWSPKGDWDRLMKFMDDARQAA